MIFLFEVRFGQTVCVQQVLFGIVAFSQLNLATTHMFGPERVIFIRLALCIPSSPLDAFKSVFLIEPKAQAHYPTGYD